MTRPEGCICNYNPDTTDGPEEDCPHHGRPYAYWVERSDALAARLASVKALADEWESLSSRNANAFDYGRWHPSAAKQLRAVLGSDAHTEQKGTGR